MTLGSTFRLGRSALGLPSREDRYVTLAEHVVLRALALGLPNRVVVLRDSWEPVSLRAFALGLPSREVLYVTFAEHVVLRALALGLLMGRSYT